MIKGFADAEADSLVYATWIAAESLIFRHLLYDPVWIRTFLVPVISWDNDKVFLLFIYSYIEVTELERIWGDLTSCLGSSQNSRKNWLVLERLSLCETWC